MKKIICFSLCAILLTGGSAFSNTNPSQKLSSEVSKRIETTADNQQVALFVENLAQKDPAKLANFLLGNKFAYVYNDSIIFLGIQGTNEVFVICQIDDLDVGTFYYVVHKKGNKLTEKTLTVPPSTQRFVKLFARQK